MYITEVVAHESRLRLGASRTEKNETGRERETGDLQLTSLITSCPHAVALLKPASRAPDPARAPCVLRLLNYLIAPRVTTPTTARFRAFFVLAENSRAQTTDLTVWYFGSSIEMIE